MNLYKKFIQAVIDCSEFYCQSKDYERFFNALDGLFSSKAAEAAFDDYLKTEGLKASAKGDYTFEQLQSAYAAATFCYVDGPKADHYNTAQKNSLRKTLTRLGHEDFLRAVCGRLISQCPGMKISGVVWDSSPYDALHNKPFSLTTKQQ